MKKQKGFTLVEVLVGLVILAIGLLGVAALSTTSIRVNANANHLTEAYQIAQAEMEKMTIASWGTLASGSSTVTSKTEKVFTNSWLVTPTGNLKDVALTTSWVDATNPETNQPITHMVELKTKIGR
jgi:type IV pilus modification protein PilV